MILKNHKAEPYKFKRLGYNPNLLRDLELNPEQEKDSLEYLAIVTDAKHNTIENQYTPLVLMIWQNVYRNKIQVETLMEGIKKYIVNSEQPYQVTKTVGKIINDRV